ncbi:MAG: polymer-forming cytoskeletal protein [Candidatus Magasanikbacteria bacterium]
MKRSLYTNTKIFFAFIMVLALFVPQISKAANFKQSKVIQIKQDQVETENWYSLSNSFNHFGTIESDLFAAAEDIETSGTTTEDQFLAGVNLELEGVIGDDLRLIGNEVSINSEVSGETILLAPIVEINSQSRLDGETVIIADNVFLRGEVGDNLRVIANNLVVDGRVDGDVEARTLNVEVTKNAVVNGDLHYSSNEEIEIPDKAQIEGEIKFESAENWPFFSKQEDKSTLGLLQEKFDRFWWLGLLSELIAGLFLFWLFKEKIKNMCSSAYSNFGRNILIGVTTFIAVPIITIALLATMFGFWFGLSGGLLFGFLVVLSQTGAGMLVGSLLEKLITKEEKFTLTWNSLAAGFIVISVLGVVPFLGGFFKTLFSAAALGTLVSYLYSYLRNVRKEE